MTKKNYPNRAINRTPKYPSAQDEKGIAVIGMACRFPGAKDYKEFWRNLEAGVNSIVEIPKDRWDWRGYFGNPRSEPNKTNSKWGGFVEDIDKFDASFFRTSPREAEQMDPQQRILLELTWGCLENSGYKPSAFSGRKVGVFIGVCHNDYKEIQENYGRSFEGYAASGTGGAILANRISYFFNFQGPSIIVDTACSSSLISIHHAVNSINGKEIELAIAGGINYLGTATRHMALSNLGMLSSTGRCQTFDKNADGYVRGEGAGLIFLKSLKQALDDNNRIFGVIKSSCMNHGGSVQTLTAPSAYAQSKLIVDAYTKANIPPNTVTYLETHGTGTPLGDPIEINGMIRAFKKLFRQFGIKKPISPHCGLGAVKTNIGHLEGAAGIAGVIKILMAMKFNKLPALQNFSTLNPRISLKDSPFYIVHETQGWKALQDTQGKEIPRRAGVSSFGFGGANAHVVIEEYVDGEKIGSIRQMIEDKEPYLIVLSAKNKDRLKEAAKNLYNYLNNQIMNLTEVAYTLQVGREAMEERISFIITNKAELKAELTDYLDGHTHKGNCFRGNIKEDRNFLDLDTSDPDSIELIKKWLFKKKLRKIAKLWCKGLDIDWSLLYSESVPQRISLPTYPFSRTRHWLSEAPPHLSRTRSCMPPLLDKIIPSMNAGVIFESRFSPSHPLVSHHRVEDRGMLPGTAYIEMIYEGLKEVSPGILIELLEHTWIQPFCIEESVKNIQLKIEEVKDGFRYQFSSGDHQQIRHSQGLVRIDHNKDGEAYLDIAKLRAGLAGVIDSPIAQESFYQKFERAGISYGENYRCLHKLWANPDVAIAYLELPEKYLKDLNDYEIAPVLFDAALQSISGTKQGTETRLFLPYSFDRLRRISSLPRTIFSYVRKVGNYCYDITLVDEKGKVLIEVVHLRVRELIEQGKNYTYSQRWMRKPARTESTARVKGNSLFVYLEPSYEFDRAIGFKDSYRICIADKSEKISDRLHYVSAHEKDGISTILSKLPAIESLYFLGGIISTESSHVARELTQFEKALTLSFFRTVKALIQSGYEEKQLQITVITQDAHRVVDNRINCFGASLTGLTASLVKEFPKWNVRQIDVSETDLSNDKQHHTIRAMLEREPFSSAGNPIVYRRGFRYEAELVKFVLPKSQRSRFKQQGVYVILGGAGGLGEITSACLIERYDAQIIWLGRRKLNEEIQQKIDRLSQIGTAPFYITANAKNPKSLGRALQTIKRRYIKVNGVFHSAIVLRDQGVRTMTEETFCSVYDPKAEGSVNLVGVFKVEELDFMCFYSSIQSVVGAAGQSNYAAGSTFEDAYAKSLENEFTFAVKIINWGYWGGVGVVAKEAYRRRMEQLGIGSLTAPVGMDVLENLLGTSTSQIIAIDVSKSAEDDLGINQRDQLQVIRRENCADIRQLLHPYSGRSTTNPPEIGHPELAAFCVKGLFRSFHSAGWLTAFHTPISIKAARISLNIVDKYDRLFQELVRLLTQENYLRNDDGMYRVEKTNLAMDNENDLDKELQALKRSYPGINAHLNLLIPCLNSLVNILQGNISATDILFADSKPDLVNAIYQGNDHADYFNELTCDAVEAYVEFQLQSLPNSEKIHVLEIGAGTGGTSQCLFKRLGRLRDRIHYVYTDISKTLLTVAEERFQHQFSHIEFALLDIEKPTFTEPLSVGGFELVVAANVLHATRDMSVTLGNVKRYLKGNGVLVVNEISKVNPFNTLTFGLLDGWWLYGDDEIRLPGSPGLSKENWKIVLAEQGFRNVHFYEFNPNLNQQVLIAQSDGLIVKVAHCETVSQRPKKNDKQHPIFPIVPHDEGRPSTPIEDDDVVRHVKGELTKIVSDALKVDIATIDVEEAFSDYGVDSILGVNLIQTINNRFELDLSTTDIFDYPTINCLTHYISKKNRHNLRQIVCGETQTVHKMKTPYANEIESNPMDVQLSERPLTEDKTSTDIAVIGMSGTFGAARHLDEYWAVLYNGKSLIEEVPDDRWDSTAYYSTDINDSDRTYCKWGSFVKDIDRFDPLFFRISGQEATMMDPQQRMFLQNCWEAIENAGINPQSLTGSKCGVYVGVAGSDYSSILSDKGPASAFWGNASSILASRISYFLNLKGPAVAVDTACSSSLVSIHMACRSLTNEECDSALAGGVFIQTSPQFYIYASRAAMLSPNGQCFAFDNRADGFVPGEGSGAVLLKRLADAEADGDPVYGVIKGSAINQDGKTNGITAPSAESQKALLLEVYEKYHIDPRTITYVEAHGTGTKLGDPIEIEALTKSFRTYTYDSRFCAIGSVKTNIGHTATAAGVACVIKVLLSLQHQQLVPSLNYETCNNHIDMEKSPFYVNTERKDWLKEGGNPRRAAVSSFGFSGTNAHVVIEEYESQSPVTGYQLSENDPISIVLSAKNVDRLREAVKNLLDYLTVNCQPSRKRNGRASAVAGSNATDNIPPTVNLHEVAYTLQVGREPMEERVAFMVNGEKELTTKLTEYLEGKSGIFDCYRGNVKNDAKTVRLFTSDEDSQKLLAKWMQKKYTKKLTELWVCGLEIDWVKLYGANLPKRIRLPSYPFAKERYWISNPANERPSHRSSIINHHSPWLHPLLHQNDSDFEKQCYVSDFAGNEFFLRDHQINNQKTLPAVIYLEMAREAGCQSLRQPIKRIGDVVWRLPVTVNSHSRNVGISLYPEMDYVYYEIITNDDGKQMVHSQGKVYPQGRQDKVAPINIRTLQHNIAKTKRKDECYQLFEKAGFHYGPSFQTIEKLVSSPHAVLSRVKGNGQPHSDFQLDPCVLDGALQSIIGLHCAESIPSVFMPYSVREVNLYQALEDDCLSYVRLSQNSEAQDDVVKYDIDILSATGEVLVQFREFAMIRVDPKPDVQPGLFYAVPQWISKGADASESVSVKKTVFLSKLLLPKRSMLLERFSDLRIMELAGSEIEENFLKLFTGISGKLKSDQGRSEVVVIVRDDESHQYGFIPGLLKTANLENPFFSGKYILVDNTEDLTHILTDESCTADEEVYHCQNQRKTKTLSFINPIAATRLPIKERGVYLITGGAGGLGLHFARYLTEKANARVILAGRSALTDEKHAIIDEIDADYRQCDTSSEQEVRALTATIIGSYGTLTGVIHGAGIIRDNVIIKKSEVEVKRVLAPKIKGIRYLDESTSHLNLDFFIGFSSIAGVVGNVGQADYAGANSYIDAYTAYRQCLEKNGKRSGKSLAIEWPLWQEGGMEIRQESTTSLQQLGGVLLPTKEGLTAFETLLQMSASYSQVLVGYGDKNKLAHYLKKDRKIREKQAIALPVEKKQQLVAKTIAYFKRMLSKTLEIESSRIDETAPLERYGIDSIIIMNVTNQLEQVFGTLSKTLFFEYQCLAELADYFVKNHTGTLLHLFAEELLPRSSFSQQSLGPRIPKLNPIRRNRFKTTPQHSQERPGIPEGHDIAVIGISGVYPGAKNLDQYWTNLEQARDCITEIPVERWDARSFFDARKNAKGKSYSKWGGFLDEVDKFDSLFFNISPREAELLDPQERLFLQTVWATLEDAGYTRERLAQSQIADLPGNVGVFVGVMYEEYQLYGAEETSKGNPLPVAGSPSSISNRVSYYLNLHGPSMAVDTMCSSSLTAIHLACRSITGGDCELAIAGGVNVSIHPYKYLLLSQGRFVSSKGKCESFGRGAEGYVPGEGVGAILLKPLSKAQNEGDQIYGIIKGSSLNHGGKTNGYTVPNPNAQGNVIRRAIEKAAIRPENISYIEAHGTGTSLGDPIEITGLTKAFASTDQFFANGSASKGCAIGSVKSNIGHCESAAGIAGVTKVLLQMKHKKLVPSLHSQTLNPNIDFRNSPFKVQQKLEDWVVSDSRPTRIAGVSSFGAGGSNAHVILEEYVDVGSQFAIRDSDNNVGANVSVRDRMAQIGDESSELKSNAPYLIVLSARNEDQLQELAKNLFGYLTGSREPETVNLTDLAYTLQTGREAMEERVAFLVTDKKELMAKLEDFAVKELTVANCFRGNVTRDKAALDLVIADEDSTELVERLVSTKNFKKLCRLWSRGLQLDWALLYHDERPQRISLPTYPFAKRRYWLPTLRSTSSAQTEGIDYSTNVRSSENPRTLAYIEEWREKEIEAPSRDLRPIQVIYFSNSTTLSTGQLVSDFGDDVLIVQRGKQFQKIANLTYAIPGAKEPPLRELFAVISTQQQTNTVILYRWSEDVGKDSFWQILNLLKAVCSEISGNVTILLTALENQDLDTCYRQAWMGFTRSVPLATPSIEVKTIYHDGQLTHRQLSQEMWYSGSVRYRNANRYELGISKDESETENTIPVLRENGVYLITGGCGGLGKIFARYLARKYGSRLVLTGRREMDASIERQLQNLRQCGAVEAIYHRASVHDRESMKRVITDVTKIRKWGLHGILHLSGVVSKTLYPHKSWPEFRDNIQAKIDGTLVLDEITVGMKLDFISYFSSVSAILGDLGMCDYSISNRFQMAYLDYRNRLCSSGTRINKGFLINWPLWKSDGMGRQEDAELYLKSSGQAYLTTDKGIEIWEKLLREDKQSRSVFFGKDNQIDSMLSRLYRSNAIRYADTTKGRIDFEAERTQQVQPKDVRREVIETLKGMVAQILKLDQSEITDDQNLSEYGFDSILLTEFVEKVNGYYGTNFPPSEIFSYPTLSKLTGYLIEMYPDKVGTSPKKGEEFVVEKIIRDPTEAGMDANNPTALPKRPKDDGIAVIGVSCHLPKADNIEQLWNILADEKSIIDEIPRERWDWRRYYKEPGDSQNKITSNKGGFLQDAFGFDASFFEISPREAKGMDPKQRLLLEESWKALEDAGYIGDKISECSCGVFIGVEESELGFMGQQGPVTGVHNGLLAARISYFLDLKGPNLAINTSCSSGLVAVHQAIHSLRSGESDVALAGGVNLLLTPGTYLSLSELSMLSENGRCSAFDMNADGIVPGEAVGVVVLKPLNQAITDRDNIYGVIARSAINYDGRTNGITAPSGVSQKELMRTVYTGIDVEDISYIVAHGTGTKLGDPVEVNALIQFFKERATKKAFCALGSVKTNFGHTFAASGVVSLISVLASMKKRTIPASLYCTQENSYIDFKESPFYVNKRTKAWELEPGKRRMAGVSAFGMSGTNAHLIVEEAPPIPKPETTVVGRPLHLLNLSTKSDGALKPLAHRYLEHLQIHSEQALGDVCYTANTGRGMFPHRLSIVGTTRIEMIAKLKSFCNGEEAAGLIKNTVIDESGKLAFLFPGVESNYPGMGRQLYETQSVFRNAIDQCTEILKDTLEQPLIDAIYQSGNDDSLLSQSAYAQPVTFAINYALYQLWKCWGITPDVVIGHGVGEYVAACVVGIFSLEDGLALAAARGRLMLELPGERSTVSLAAPAEEIRSEMTPDFEDATIVAINGPRSTVISGTKPAVDSIVSRARDQGIRSQTLPQAMSFYSSPEPTIHEFEQTARKITYTDPGQVQMISTVDPLTDPSAILTPEYWCRQLLAPVNFAAAIDTLSPQSRGVFIECGPSPQLLERGRACWPNKNAVWLPSLRTNKDDWTQIVQSVSELFTEGIKIDWVGFDRDTPYRTVKLPTHPFQRERYCLDINDTKMETSHDDDRQHPLLGRYLELAGDTQSLYFESTINADSPEYLTDHRVFETVIFPGAAFLEMALSAGGHASQSEGIVLEDVVMKNPLLLDGRKNKTIQLVLTPIKNQHYQFEIYSGYNAARLHEQGWTAHASGTLMGVSSISEMESPLETDFQSSSPGTAIDIEAFFQRLKHLGIDYGPRFRGLKQILKDGQGRAIGRVTVPPMLGGVENYRMHPALLDSALQVLGGLFVDDHVDNVYLPFSIERFQWYRSADTELTVIASRDQSSNKTLSAHVTLLNPDKQVVAALKGVQMRAATQQFLFNIGKESLRDCLYEVAWRSQARFGDLDAPGFIPDPQRIATRLLPNLRKLLNNQVLKNYSSLIPRLERLSLAYMLQALDQLGWTFEPGEEFTLQTVTHRLGVVPEHHRFLRHLLHILCEENIVETNSDRWIVLQRLPKADPNPQLHHLLSDSKHIQAELALVQRCGEDLSNVLCGAVDPVQLVFPAGELTATTRLYSESPASVAFNKLISEVVALVIERIPDQRGIRILEVGAGTGGTTSHLLNQLPANQTQYCFSDVGALFLKKAKKRFEAYAFVDYQTLDIEKAPADQGFTPRRQDLIIAANVLHATEDITKTLQHIKQLLAPGGLLILLEGTARHRWVDLIFGLLEGWWRFKDRKLRPDHPLLSPYQWRQVLQANGFYSIAVLPPPEEEANPKQAAILARSTKPTAKRQKTKTRGWLVLSDKQEVGGHVAEQLRARGDVCVVYKSSSRSVQDYKRLIKQITNETVLYGVIHCWALDCPDTATIAVDSLDGIGQKGCGTLIGLVQALTAANFSSHPRLWIVTRGAQAVFHSNTSLPGLGQAPLWGLGKVITLEHPELQCTRVDLDPDASLKQQAVTLYLEVMAGDPEDQVAVRQNKRYIARLQASSQLKEGQAKLVVPHEPFRLTVTRRGSLDSLTLVPVVRSKPKPGEVEIEVKATGLNFLDVVAALDLIPDQVDGVSQHPIKAMNHLGEDCAGVITAVGKEVDGLAVGDPVIAVTSGAFSQYLTVKINQVITKPKNLSFEEAASIPSNFLTAYQALYRVAKIKANDSILIHAGTGGTGMAAIQIAQKAGAEVFATASPSKWEKLREMGVSHIMNSRTTKFAETIMQKTGGRGVDIILNSLTSGDFVAKSLSVLSKGGRFIEIAKRGVWSSAEVAASRPDVAYTTIDLIRILQEQPAGFKTLLSEIGEQFESGVLHVLPLTLFKLPEIVDAFRYMQQAKHIGKIVVSQQSLTSTSSYLPADASYMITGGLGELGLLIAQWLVHQGAKHLVLVSRRAPNETLRKQIETLEQGETQISVVEADVTDYDAMDRVLQDKDPSLPLRGIIHAAGVVDDATINKQTWKKFSRVMAPKVQGAWILHQLTKEADLDFFILLSSVASLLGIPGQANHSAANAFLDGLAHYRQSIGLPGQSIHLGAVSRIGEAAERGADVAGKKQGIKPISPKQVLLTLDHLVRNPKVVEIGLVDLDWTNTSGWLQWSESRFLANWRRYFTAPISQNESNFLDRLKAVIPTGRRRMFVDHLQQQIARVLGIASPQTIDVRKGFFELGMDSLTSVELRNLLQRSLGRSLATTAILDYPTIESLVDHLLNELFPKDLGKNPEAESRKIKEISNPNEELEELPEEELAALLADELYKGNGDLEK